MGRLILVVTLFVIRIIIERLVNGAKQHLPNVAIRRGGVYYVPMSCVNVETDNCPSGTDLSEL